MSGVGQAVFMNQRSFVIPPVNTVVPVITGTAQTGLTLSVSDGTWTGTTPITFTYQWQRVTTNISGATSSTYTLVTADEGNTIRCVVTATNAAAAVSVNTANTATVSLPAIGAAYGGGFFVGQLSTTANGVATHNLVAGPRSVAQNVLQWKSTNTATPGANSVINGPQNTADMVADGNSTVYPCAHFCNNLTIGGFSDFYMPAQNEWELCYFNLKPTTQNNATGLGGHNNPNAVPARANNYTNNPRVPDQTSAAAFQSGGAEAFPALRTWNGTQTSNSEAGRLDFSNGGKGVDFKVTNYTTRAVRRVAV